MSFSKKGIHKKPNLNEVTNLHGRGFMGENIVDDDDLAREIMQVEADDDDNYEEGDDGMVDERFSGDQVEIVEGSDGFIEQDGEGFDGEEDDIGEDYGDEQQHHGKYTAAGKMMQFQHSDANIVDGAEESEQESQDHP